MPIYRVNTRIDEHWVRQYEIIADSPELAAALIPIMVGEMGATLKVTGEEKVGETFGDPETFTVSPAEPLQAMEEAQKENDAAWKKRAQERAFQTATEAHDIDMTMPDNFESSYENIGGQIQSRKRGKHRGRYSKN